MAAVGAASEREPLTAAVLDARASIGAQLDGGAEAKVDATAALTVPAELPTIPSRPSPEQRPPPRPPPQNGTNETETNKTPAGHTDPVPAPENETAGAPATLAPHEQELRGQAGAPIRFVVFLTNTADVAQNVSLVAKAPAGWDVRLSPESALLGPDETVPVTGTVVTPRLVGTAGTVAIRALGPGGEDVAYVDLCTVGELQQGCRDGRPYAQRGDEPASNETGPRQPAANETTPAPEPQPEPETGPTPAPEPQPEPAPAPKPAPNATKSPPSNGTAPPPAGGGSGSSNGTASPSAEAWLTIEASVAGADGEDHDDDDATDEEGTDEEDESPPPVTVDV